MTTEFILFWLFFKDPPGFVWVALGVVIFFAIAGVIGESIERDRRDRRVGDKKTPGRKS